MGRWGRSRVMEGATAPTSPARRGHSTQQLTTTIAALQFVYDRTHAQDGPRPAGRQDLPPSGWSFLSSHARVLVCLAETPERHPRQVAAAAGLSEGETARIMADLLAEGYLRPAPGPGATRYEVDPDRPLRHPAERGARLGDLLAAWGQRSRPA